MVQNRTKLIQILKKITWSFQNDKNLIKIAKKISAPYSPKVNSPHFSHRRRSTDLSQHQKVNNNKSRKKAHKKVRNENERNWSTKNYFFFFIVSITIALIHLFRGHLTAFFVSCWIINCGYCSTQHSVTVIVVEKSCLKKMKKVVKIRLKCGHVSVCGTRALMLCMHIIRLTWLCGLLHALIRHFYGKFVNFFFWD